MADEPEADRAEERPPTINRFATFYLCNGAVYTMICAHEKLYKHLTKLYSRIDIEQTNSGLMQVTILPTSIVRSVKNWMQSEDVEEWAR